MRPEDVTFGSVPKREYEVTENSILVDQSIDPEAAFTFRIMLKSANHYKYDWVQFYNEDRKILYHGNVVDET